jgi:uncharacterized protein YhaN
MEVQVKAPGAEKYLFQESLSSGTLDQLYFTLRVALGEYLTGRSTFPLILDDPFITFDPERLKQAVRILQDLARGHQILWFTKDPSAQELLGKETTVIHV